MLTSADKRKVEQILKLADTDTSSIETLMMQHYLDSVNREDVSMNIFATSPMSRRMHPQQKSENNTNWVTYESNSEDRKVPFVLDNSETSSLAVRDANERDHQYFCQNEYKFLYTLRHSVFEDGCDNEATELFNSMLSRNKYVAIAWLYEFWCDHQDDSIVFKGIIRLIGRVSDKGYWKTLFSIVRNGFTDKDTEVQEAAIMVAESWRNKNCLEALKNTVYASPWIRNYANQIIEELTEELADEIH